MQITLVERDSTVFAYLPSGQLLGDGGTLDIWRQWLVEHHPAWPAPIVAEKPPEITVGPAPEHGEICPLCHRRKRDAWEYRLNAIALEAFGYAAPDEPPRCRLCNPGTEP